MKLIAKGIYHAPRPLLGGLNRIFDRKNRYSDLLDADVKTALMALNKFVDSDFVTLTPDEARGKLEDDADLALAPKMPNIRIENTQIANTEVLVAMPINADENSPFIIYLHGGGWVLGSASTTKDTISLIANATNSVVISLDYPLAPEHTYGEMLTEINLVVDQIMDPEGIELFGKTFKPTKFGMTGESAGGHLTTSVNIERIKENKKQVDVQIPLVPVTDFTDFDTKSYIDYQKGYYLTREQMIWYRSYFVGEDKEKWVSASPYLEDKSILSKLNRTHICVAHCDVLHNDGKKYYELLKSLGVDATFQIAKGQIHIFPSAPYMWRGAKDAMLEVCEVFNTEFNK